MADLFDKLIAQGVREGQIPARTQQARDWFRNVARGQKINDNKIEEVVKERAVAQPDIGSMYLFRYDAKYKDTLPYWDAMPLVFPFKAADGGFYGINVHYLQPQLRAKLMDGLYMYTTNTRYNDSTRMLLKNGFLDAASKISYVKPCVKRYLKNHVVGGYTYIHPTEWDIALFLPLADWRNQSAKHVYKQTRKMVY